MRPTRRRIILGGGLALIGGGLMGSRLLGPGADPTTSGRSRARPVQTEAKPPLQADVVVIGGGNIGAASAYYLSKRGLSVVLCEKGAIAGEASGRSVGWVYSLGQPPGKIEVTSAARAIWHGLNAELELDTGFRPNGLIIEIPDAEARAEWVDWLRQHEAAAPAARILDRDAVRSHVDADPPWFGAIHDPTDGCAEPTLVAPAFAEAARRKGARLVAPCAVRGFETAAGRIASVVTEHGEIKTTSVVVAGGAWSSMLLKNFGLSLPSANVFSWCTSFYGVNGPEGAGGFSNTTWRRQIDGGYTTSIKIATAPLVPDLLVSSGRYRHIAQRSGWDVRLRLGRYFFEELWADGEWKLDEETPFERRRILEPEPYPQLIDAMLQKMRRGIPAFRELRPGQAWGGALTNTPDDKPVLGPVAAVPGLIVATAFADGLTMAPAVGEVVAELISGETPSVPLGALQFERFSR